MARLSRPPTSATARDAATFNIFEDDDFVAALQANSNDPLRWRLGESPYRVGSAHKESSDEESEESEEEGDADDEVDWVAAASEDNSSENDDFWDGYEREDVQNDGFVDVIDVDEERGSFQGRNETDQVDDAFVNITDEDEDDDLLPTRVATYAEDDIESYEGDFDLEDYTGELDFGDDDPELQSYTLKFDLTITPTRSISPVIRRTPSFCWDPKFPGHSPC